VIGRRGGGPGRKDIRPGRCLIAGPTGTGGTGGPGRRRPGDGLRRHEPGHLHPGMEHIGHSCRPTERRCVFLPSGAYNGTVGRKGRRPFFDRKLSVPVPASRRPFPIPGPGCFGRGRDPGRAGLLPQVTKRSRKDIGNLLRMPDVSRGTLVLQAGRGRNLLQMHKQRPLRDGQAYSLSAARQLRPAATARQAPVLPAVRWPRESRGAAPPYPLHPAHGSVSQTLLILM
jgi:hypothetical protein